MEMKVRAYHGSNQLIDEFKHGLDEKGHTSKYGYWFTDSISEASDYGNYCNRRNRVNQEEHDKLISSYLNRIEIASDMGDWDLHDRLTEEMEEIEFSEGDSFYYLYTVDLTLENPLVYEVDGYFDQEVVIKSAIEDGYDSVIFKNISDSPTVNIKSTHYIVFDFSSIEIVSVDKIDGCAILESEASDMSNEINKLKKWFQANIHTHGSDEWKSNKVRINELRSRLLSDINNRIDREPEGLYDEYSTPEEIPKDVLDWIGSHSSLLYSDASDAVRWSRIIGTEDSDRYPGGLMKIYRAVESPVYDVIRAGDWVTTDIGYARAHNDRYFGGTGHIIEDTVDGRDVLISPTGDASEAIYAPLEYSSELNENFVSESVKCISQIDTNSFINHVRSSDISKIITESIIDGYKVIFESDSEINNAVLDKALSADTMEDNIIEYLEKVGTDVFVIPTDRDGRELLASTMMKYVSPDRVERIINWVSEFEGMSLSELRASADESKEYRNSEYMRLIKERLELCDLSESIVRKKNPLLKIEKPGIDSIIKDVLYGLDEYSETCVLYVYIGDSYNSIGIIVNPKSGDIEIYEENEESNRATIDAVIALTKDPDEYVKVYSSQPGGVSNQIYASNEAPTGMFVSKDLSYARKYLQEGRDIISFEVQYKYISPHSPYDWQIIESAPVRKLKYV